MRRTTLFLLPFLLLTACASDEATPGGEEGAADSSFVEEAVDGMAETPAEGAVYTLRGATAGDVACYVDLEDETGAQSTEMASFEVCDLTDLVGKQVAVTRGMGNVLADSCEGNPDCTETQEVELITAMEAAP